MASVTTTPATVLETYVRDHLDDDPKAVLDIALAETERLRLVAEAKAKVQINADGTFEVSSLEGLWRLAEMYSLSEMVPDHFRGKSKTANCAVAVNLALRWGWDPLMVLQKCYVFKGKPGLESQLIIARANTSGVFKGRIGYQLSREGDRRQCIASAVLVDSGELVTHTIDIAMAKRMGWYDKKDSHGNLCSLWPKMPDLMLTYRSAAWLVRTVAPEVLMGVYMKEELQEMDEDDLPTTATAKPSLEEMLEGGASMGVDPGAPGGSVSVKTVVPNPTVVTVPMKVLDPPEAISPEAPPAESKPSAESEEPPVQTKGIGTSLFDSQEEREFRSNYHDAILGASTKAGVEKYRQQAVDAQKDNEICEGTLVAVEGYCDEWIEAIKKNSSK